MSYIYKVCLLIMVALLVAAFQSAPSTTPTSPLTLYPLPNNVQFHFQGQTPEHEALMRAGVQAAYNYLRSIGLEETSAPVDLYAYEDQDLLIDAVFERFGRTEQTLAMQRNIRSGHNGLHSYGFSVVWTASPLTSAFKGDDNWWFAVQASPYIEAVLEGLAGPRPISATGGQPDGEPAWIILGFSRYLIAKAIDAAGIADNYFLENRAMWRSESSRDTTPLGALELYNGTDEDPGKLGILAAEYLAAQSGDGALLQFYRNIGQGMNRYDAFTAAFGMRISQFYEDYRAYRREHYPVFYQAVGGTLVDAQGNGVDNIWIWACPLEPTYDCYPVHTLTTTTIVSTTSGDFGNSVPLGEILIAFGTTVKPGSIFGYYQQVEGNPPTAVPDDKIIGHYYAHLGTVTPNRDEATLVTISSQTLDSFGAYNIYVQLPPNLP